MFPHAWGWTVGVGELHVERPDVPTRVGMDRRVTSPMPTYPTMSPHAWGWTDRRAAVLDEVQVVNDERPAALREDGGPSQSWSCAPHPCPRICPRDPLKLAPAELRRVITVVDRMWPLCRAYVRFGPGDCDA